MWAPAMDGSKNYAPKKGPGPLEDRPSSMPGEYNPRVYATVAKPVGTVLHAPSRDGLLPAENARRSLTIGAVISVFRRGKCFACRRMKPENRDDALAYADLYHGAEQYFQSPRSLHFVATTEAYRNVLGRVHDPLILEMISVVIKTYNTSTILHGLVHERLLELQ
ncbi:hypothetical protein B0H11DRAFT_2190322 [Mycena galericulata]|nr:hypothetical protein B0H11DRAFT_2190322 [Mycena galericulata]